MRRVTVCFKEGCHLCENVLEALKELEALNDIEVVKRDITTDRLLLDRFKNIIPVVEIDGKIKIAGAALSNPNTLEDVLHKALSST